nr:glycosyltransferase family 2 protein [uncultured Bacteroides sp.]
MIDLTTIILTYNEEIHIRRCLENVCPASKKVYVIDSPSTDRTVEICNEFKNVEVVVHKYPGNQAEQLNWALDNLDIQTDWILRIDADEYLSQELIVEIEEKTSKLPTSVTGINLQRNHFFMGKQMKYERNAIILRMFRNGKARCECRLMDEYMLIKEGTTITYDNLFFDHNLCTLSEYCQKHINYASREVAMILDEGYGLSDYKRPDAESIGRGVSSTRKAKGGYQRLPLFWRSFAYFIYRYFFTGTFLLGKAGFVYCFIQAWWYRTLVDGILLEVRNSCKSDPELVKKYLLDRYKIKL